MSVTDTFLRRGLKNRHLLLLIALDDYRSIGKVAIVSNLSQSAISKALAEIEKGLALRLFERTTRGLQPTVYGESLVRYAREWARELNDAREELRGIVSGTSGRVNIGVLTAAATVLLPKGLTVMKARAPGIRAVVREGPIDVMIADLRQGKLDLVIGTLIRQLSIDLDEEVLLDAPATVIVRKHHPLTKMKKLAWKDVRNVPWVLPPEGSLMREPLEAALDQHGMTIYANLIETGSIQVTCAYVGSTDAIAVVPRDVADHYAMLNLVQILPLNLPPVIRPAGMIWSRERPLLSSTKLFMECLREAASSEQ